MEKIFIIDASGYLYSSYFAIRNMTNSKGESTNALFGFIRSVHKLIKDFHPTHLVAVFDGPRNAKKRLEIYPEYKAHRLAVPQDLPYQISWGKEFCEMFGLPYLNIPEVEADDTIGVVSKWAEKQGAQVYICSTDKDLSQLVTDRVAMLNTRKENLIFGPKEIEDTYGVPPNKIIDLLALIGDSSDNVPGVPGIGPKTASALIKEFGSLDQLLESADKIVGDKKRLAIIEHKDKAILSRQLVTLDLNVSIPNTEEFYQFKTSDVDRLKSFYSSMSFNSLIREMETTIHSQIQLALPLLSNEDYQLIDDKESLDELISFLKLQKQICFDTETTDIHPLKAELVGIGFCVKPEKAWYIPVNGKLGLNPVLEAVKPLFENNEIGFYGHNAKYDYQILMNYGITVSNFCFDTILASYLLNSHNRQHNLDNLALQYFGKVKIPIADLIGKGKSTITMREVPIEKACAYCCEDVDYTCRLKLILEQEIKERQLENLMQSLELPLSKVLAKMERYGIFLNVPRLKNISQAIIEQISLIENEIFTLAGTQFNLNSPKQLSQILQEKLLIPLPKKTASGFSTNADILESLKDVYPIAGVILEYRTLEKLRSTYIQSLPEEVLSTTNRIHSTFNQSVAATGRLASQDPNLQNIPIRTEAGRKIREAFHPQSSDWSYLAADYSQIELRLLAHFSEDPNLIRAFQNNEDIHASTAAAIFNIPLDQVKEEQRYHAKAVNFGIIYGQQAFGLAKELKIDVKSAAAFIETYFKRFNKVKEFIELCKKEARITGKAVTFIGRQRLIPEIHSKNGQLRMLAERLAVNTPLQGTAADLIKLAMLKVDQQISEMKLKGYMVLQIHDELIFEIPDNEIEIFTLLVKNTMQDVFKLKIPLIVDITIGKNWKEC
jgi:DNA polymerase-1